MLIRPRARSTRCLLVVVLTAGLLGAPAIANAQSAASNAAPATSSWAPTTLTVPYGPDTDGLDSLSCPAPGSCVALGQSTARGGVVETLADGTWTTTVPAGPDGTGVGLSVISCPSTTSCDAVGYYGPAGAPVLARLHNGSWSYTTLQVTGYFHGISCAAAGHCTAIGDGPGFSGAGRNAIYAYAIDGTTVTQSQLSIPADLTDIYSVSAAGISCATTTSCTAVGTAIDGDADEYSGDHPFAEQLSGGTWSALDLPYGDGDFVSSVSCPSTTTCYAIGQRQSKYGPASGSSYSIKIVGDTVTTTPFGKAAQLNAVSCGDVTHCVAFGSTDASTVESSNEPASAVLSGDTWTVEVRAYPPGSPGPLSEVFDIDCADATFCVAAGYLKDPVERRRFLAETFADGAWSASNVATIPGPATGSASALSCRSSTSCVIVGSEVDTTDRTRPLAEVLSGGTRTRSTLPSPHGSVGASLDAVSCPTTDACTAVGQYADSDGRQLIFADRYNGGVWHADGIALGIASGYEEALTAVDCFSATSCVAVGYYVQKQAGDSMPFAAVLSDTHWTKTALPRTGVVNGLDCQSVTSCVAVGGGYDTNRRAAPVAWTLSGTKWTLQYLPHTTDTPALMAVSCVSATACTAIGGFTYAETLTGTTWAISDLPRADLTSISCVTATACTAVGEDGDLPAVETHTASGWTEETLATPKRRDRESLLSDVQCLTATGCLAVGTAYTDRYPDVGLPLIEQRS